ncbi:MAG: hypothetical protein GXN93_04680 [Candidatus Diapherotrites archaeon]|nr:hypothetical protein [Candidatus Diapherotrites archaeon]
MHRIPIGRCPGLSSEDIAFLRSVGIRSCFVGRVIDSIYGEIHAVPLFPVAPSVYIAYLPEFRDPGVVYVEPSGKVLIFDQFEPVESLELGERQRNILLRYFNSVCHSPRECYQCAKRLLSQKSLIHRIFSNLLGRRS